MTVQDYKAHKQSRILKRIGEQLRQNVRDHEKSSSAGQADDLQSLLNSMTGQRPMTKTKGSRFTQIEKLQFAQVHLTGSNEFQEYTCYSKYFEEENIYIY